MVNASMMSNSPSGQRHLQNSFRKTKKLSKVLMWTKISTYGLIWFLALNSAVSRTRTCFTRSHIKAVSILKEWMQSKGLHLKFKSRNSARHQSKSFQAVTHSDSLTCPNQFRSSNKKTRKMRNYLDLVAQNAEADVKPHFHLQKVHLQWNLLDSD